MKQSQILVFLLLLTTNYGMQAALPKEEHWIGHKNPFDGQFDGQLQFHGDSFQQVLNQKHENECGRTFLSRAISWVVRKYNVQKNIQKIETLIELGADVNSLNSLGYIPLHYAAAKNESEIIQLLITAGANINRQDSHGYTPLHWAAIQNASEAMITLLHAGAATTISNELNLTARQSIIFHRTLKIFDEAVRQSKNSDTDTI